MNQGDWLAEQFAANLANLPRAGSGDPARLAGCLIAWAIRRPGPFALLVFGCLILAWLRPKAEIER